ncbi:MAG: MBL fold metallo-hydrolase [Spirochaetia bacterium]
MKVKFWGVRGSIPTPLTQSQLRSRIAAAVARIRPADLESAETREAFLAKLPPYIFGSVGGNTTCLSIHAEDTPLVIIDAGSGIRELAAMVNKQKKNTREFHIFFTHFHWDHLQGLPFFSPVGYKKSNTLYFYSPKKNLEEIVRGQMVPPYFPVDMDAMAAKKCFIRLKSPATRLGKLEIGWKSMRHPGGCVAYKMSHNGRSMIFATDAELSPEDFKRTPENSRFFENTDLLILDSQYTLGEAIEKYDWGHTSYSMAVDFAAEWNIKTLALFHHEPLYNDRKIYGILNSAEWYRARLGKKQFRVILAVEGLELEI